MRSPEQSRVRVWLTEVVVFNLIMQHGGVAPSFGMAPPPGMAAAAGDDGRFCLPWAAAAHFENWGDSGIVATSPLAETTCTDAGGDRHQAQTVC